MTTTTIAAVLPPSQRGHDAAGHGKPGASVGDSEGTPVGNAVTDANGVPDGDAVGELAALVLADMPGVVASTELPGNNATQTSCIPALGLLGRIRNRSEPAAFRKHVAPTLSLMDPAAPRASMAARQPSAVVTLAWPVGHGSRPLPPQEYAMDTPCRRIRAPSAPKEGGACTGGLFFNFVSFGGGGI